MTPSEHRPPDQVDRLDNPSPVFFHDHHVARGTPVQITGVVSRWPAFQRWSFDFFRSIGRDKTVHLEVGNVMQASTEFRKEGFAEYLDRVERSATTGRPDTAPSGGPAGAPAPQAYLSIFEMFDMFPQLESDVDFSLLASRKLLNLKYGWFGPAGTVTGYHTDCADNLLAQIRGRKIVHLVPPDQSDCMYPSGKFDFGSTLSQVDKNLSDLSRFPRFAEIRPLRALLAPGEMLFIPRGWWHHVQSLDVSISVNNFGLTLGAMLTDGVREAGKFLAHQARLYGRECTCHVMVNGRRVRR